MATVPSTSNILITVSKFLLAGVLVLVVVPVALWLVFGQLIPFTLENVRDYPATQTAPAGDTGGGSAPSGTPTATPVVIHVPVPTPVVAAAPPPAPVDRAPPGAAGSTQGSPVTQYIGTTFGDMAPVGQGCVPDTSEDRGGGNSQRCRTNLRIQEQRLPDGTTQRRACETTRDGRVLEDTCQPVPQT